MRGLPSITEARRARSKISWMPPKFWVWTAVILGASFIFWWKWEEGRLQSMRSELLSRQRTVVAELGQPWDKLRTKIEKWTVQCAKGKQEFVNQHGLAKWNFREQAGIYLRLGSSQASSPDDIRKAAQQSLHDGFTACLMVVPNPSPLAGPKCRTSKDCPAEQHCNEFDHCAKHSQPYNLRLAFKTMRVMTDEWVDGINSLRNELEMRGAVATFDEINRFDIPVAIRLLTQAKYFLVVVDDSSKAAEGQPEQEADGGALSANWEIPTAPHTARVCVWRLADDKRGTDDQQLLAIEREAAGVLMGAGATNPRTRQAQQRQANSCSLALEVRKAIGDENVPELP